MNKLSSALVGFALLTSSGAQEMPRKDWKAKWIDHPTAPLREPMVFHFRKLIELGGKPAKFVVHVSADNRFILYINSVRVGDGPARGDLQHWRYESFDLSPYLKAGRNVIAATVWNFGIYSPMAQVSDRTAFLVEGDTSAEAAVNSNDSWSVEEEYGHTCLPRAMNEYKEYFVAGPGESIDAAKYDWQWSSAEDGPNSHWISAGPAMRESVLFDGSHPWSHDRQNDTPWLLEPDQLPKMDYRPVSNGTGVRADNPSWVQFPDRAVIIPAHAAGNLLIARDAVTTAYPRLSVSGGKGSSIHLVYAGALVDSKLEKGIRTEIGDRKAIGLIDEFLPDGGTDRVFEPLWWRGYRFLELQIKTGDEPLTLNSLATEFTVYPFEQKAYFRSNDEELNFIWSIAWYTATLNAHETYVDSAAVEQLQYVADIRPQLLVSYAVTGDDRLARQAIVAIDDSRIPEGLTQSRYPNNIFQVIDPYSLLWIGEVYDYWQWRPDQSFVEDRLLGERTVLDWYGKHQGADGMLKHLPFNEWQDWIGKDNRTFPREDAEGRSAIITLEYAVALRQAAQMEDALGYKFLADEYRKRAGKAAQGSYRLCWDAAAGLLADTPDRKNFSQQTIAWAVLADALPARDQADILRRMSPEEYPDFPRKAVPLDRSSYYYRFYTTRAMEHAGISAEFEPMMKPWRTMLRRGFTTFPETPDPTREEAQGWGAHPAFDLLYLVAGIQPASLGFKRVRIAPELGSLTSLEAAMPAPAGLVSVKYDVSGDHLTARITLPAEMTGSFVWKGQTRSLHSGEQGLDLVASVSGDRKTAKGISR